MRTATEGGDGMTNVRWWRYIVLVGALWLVPLKAAAQTWVPTDLNFMQGEGSQAYAVGDNGTVVGASYTRGFVWVGGSGSTSLESFTFATDINSAGQIAGYGPAGNRSHHAFRWTAQGDRVDLGTLGGPRSFAYAINSVGQVVGTSDIWGNGPRHAFLWTPDSGMFDLGTLGGNYSVANGINDAGQVVGDSTTASGETHAFVWSSSTGMVDLGPGIARSVNNLGHIVGSAGGRAVLWESGTVTDLGTLGGGSSAANDINDFGQIVGESAITGNMATHAFSRRAGGPMVDLGTLGGNNSYARGVNNAGQVVGYADGNTFVEHATIWSGPWKDVVGDFGPGYGIWALRQAAWLPVHGWSPKAIVSGDFDGNGLDDLAIDFSPNSGVWLWMNHATWVPLHDQSPTTMAAGDFDRNGKSDLVLSFPGSGVWGWMNNTTWRSLHPFEAVHLAVGDLDGGGVDDLIADFPGYGLWAFWNNTTWGFVHPYSVTTMTTVDLDNNGKVELVASFQGYGIWVLRNSTTWTLLHPYAAEAIAAGQLDGGAQADLVIDFGPSLGIWTYRNSATWSQATSLSSTALVVADFDGDGRDEIAAGFGADGVWRYSATAASPWTFLTPSAASALVASRIH